MEKSRIIIIEGAQGAGKSTTTNLLREKMTSVNLIRMSGVKDKSITGKSKSFRVHKTTLEMIEKLYDCDINFVLDRSFLSEVLYCELGFKPYTSEGWEDYFKTVMKSLTKKYRLEFVLLKPDKEELKERLNRNKGEYQSFTVESSILQTNKYIELFNHEFFYNIPVNIIEVKGKSPDKIVKEIMNF
jgi:adenylate kinase family enzyme